MTSLNPIPVLYSFQGGFAYEPKHRETTQKIYG